MANEEQLAILRQGVEVWNEWRGAKFDTNIDLAYSNLSDADLKGAYLDRADLSGANLSGANLLIAKLWFANLSGARLIRANLTQAELSEADLSKANFSFANLSETNLNGAKFTNARFAHTLFSFTDLSEVIDIDKAVHFAPSSIGRETLATSKGKIPEIFLRGCGLSDWEIESTKLYNPRLTNEEIVKIQYRIYDLLATQAVQIAPLFISYSHVDKPFVDKLDSVLTEKGVRFWRDIHDAVAGRLETQIDRAIRQNPTVLLVLSKNSIKSDWVEHEVRTARELEKELGRDALCPIALDDGWKSSPWPKRVMEQVMEYNILDFSDWEDQSAFEGKFAKLLNGLDLFYKKAKE